MPEKKEVYVTLIRESQEDFRSYLFDNSDASASFAKYFLLNLIKDKLENSEINHLLKDEGFQSIDTVPLDVLELWCCDYDLGYIHLELKPIHSDINFIKLWG